MFCHKCGVQIPDDAVFCSACGEKTLAAKKQEAINTVPSGKTEEADAAFAAEEKENFLLACLRGHKSLAFSFWVLYVIGNLAVIKLFSTIVPKFNSMGLIIAATAATYVFYIFQCVSTWRASIDYTGFPLWKYLARAVIIYGCAKNIWDLAKII